MEPLRNLGYTPAEAYMLCTKGDAILVDLRAPYETNFRTFDVPAVIPLERNAFQEGFSGLPKDKLLILVDPVGITSKQYTQFLRDHDFEASFVIGGVLEWVKDGLPMIVDPDYELRGQCACRLSPKKKS
jgi:rhodanese-related sulfurtransferase